LHFVFKTKNQNSRKLIIFIQSSADTCISIIEFQAKFRSRMRFYVASFEPKLFAKVINGLQFAVQVV